LKPKSEKLIVSNIWALTSPQKRVANLWTEFSTQRRYAMIANVKEPQNPNKLVVAATYEVAKVSFLPNL
jgi:hypothetical protein